MKRGRVHRAGGAPTSTAGQISRSGQMVKNKKNIKPLVRLVQPIIGQNTIDVQNRCFECLDPHQTRPP